MPEPIEERVQDRDERVITLAEAEGETDSDSTEEDDPVLERWTVWQRVYRRVTTFLCEHKKSSIFAVGVSVAILACAQSEIGYDRDATHRFTWKSYFSMWITLMSLLLMVNDIAPESSLLMATLLLFLTGVITSDEAWAGIGSTSALSPGPLFVVAKGIEKAGTIQFVVKYVLGKPKTVREALLRLTLPVCVVSCFVNDTPVVMMMMPICEKWSRETGIPLQQILMPLSFAALLGGTCTVIGSSTNLVLQGLVEDENDPNLSLDFFTMTPAAAPAAFIACFYLVLFGPTLLPHTQEEQKRKEDLEEGPALKQYVIQVLITSAIAKSKETPETLGLTANRLSKPLGIMKGGSSDNVVAVEGNEAVPLEGGDVVVLLSTIPQFLELRRRIEIVGGHLPSFAPQYAQLGKGRRQRKLFEVVLSPMNPLLGKQMNSADFLKRYNAALFTIHIPQAVEDTPGSKIGHTLSTSEQTQDVPMGTVLTPVDGTEVAERCETPVDNVRSEAHMRSDVPRSVSPLAPPPVEPAAENSLQVAPKPASVSLTAIRETPLQASDCVLVEAYEGFAERYQSSAEFLSVAEVPDSEPPRFEKRKDAFRKYLAGILLAGMVASVASDEMKVFNAALCVAVIMVLTHTLSSSEAYNAIRLRILFAIVFAYGVGTALKKTNVTRAIADLFVSIAKHFYAMGDVLGSIGVLFFVYLACSLMSCIVSNQATVILLFPIVKGITDLEGTSLMRFTVVLLIGASCSFMTPFGYQTNLMVMRPGGYEFLDYTKFGAPLTILMGVLTAVFTRFFVN